MRAAIAFRLELYRMGLGSRLISFQQTGFNVLHFFSSVGSIRRSCVVECVFESCKRNQRRMMHALH